MGCCQSVNNAELGVVEHCGKFERIAKPGLLIFPVPCWCVKRGTLSVRVQQLNVDVETKTQDNVFTTVTVAVQYEVQQDKAYDAFYKLADAREQIKSYVFDVVRSSVPAMPLDDVFESKEHVAVAIKTRLAEVMNSFGYFIIQALVVDVAPDTKVKNAMNEINTSRRLRMAASERAEADKTLLVARAQAGGRIQGIGRQRKAIIDGLKTSVSDFQAGLEGMGSKDVLELVLLTQYFDTLESIGAGSSSNVLFLGHNPGCLQQLSTELQQGLVIN